MQLARPHGKRRGRRLGLARLNGGAGAQGLYESEHGTYSILECYRLSICGSIATIKRFFVGYTT